MTCKHENKTALRKTKNTPHSCIRRYGCHDCDMKVLGVEVLLDRNLEIPDSIKSIKNASVRKKLKDAYMIISAIKTDFKMSSNELSDFILKTS